MILYTIITRQQHFNFPFLFNSGNGFYFLLIYWWGVVHICEAYSFSKSWTISLGLINHGSSANMETFGDQQYLDSRLLVHVKVNPTAAYGSRCRTKPLKRLGRAMYLSGLGQMGSAIFTEWKQTKIEADIKSHKMGIWGEISRWGFIFQLACWGPGPYSWCPKSYNLNGHIHCKAHQCS